MHSSVFLVAFVSAVLPFTAAMTLVASADEGSPTAPASASPRVRPPTGVLRHVDAPTASPGTESTSKELVVLVGGYQSCACPDDGTFDALRRQLATMPGLTVVRFGEDPRFPYDTYGPIDPSAASLRDEIRFYAPGYSGVHIVTHSMGGVVADRAFANGLSRADGVVTYVSWSAPHDGSDAARGIELARKITATFEPALRDGLLKLQMDPDSAAVRDLARTRATAVPAGVIRLDLRQASDVLVTAREARDPGVPSRDLVGGWDGHGGILTDTTAIDLTMRTIASRRVPPDDRALALQVVAAVESDWAGQLARLAVSVLTVACCLAVVLGRRARATPFANALRHFIPRGQRKLCP
jgi:hypothetical protein